MGEFALAIIFGVLSFAGLAGIISSVCLSVYNISGGTGEYIILPVKGHMEDIEFRIRGALAHKRRSGRHFSGIYVVDFGADAETAEIAKRLCKEFEALEWLDSFELTQNIRSKLNVRK